MFDVFDLLFDCEFLRLHRNKCIYRTLKINNKHNYNSNEPQYSFDTLIQFDRVYTIYLQLFVMFTSFCQNLNSKLLFKKKKKSLCLICSIFGPVTKTYVDFEPPGVFKVFFYFYQARKFLRHFSTRVRTNL